MKNQEPWKIFFSEFAAMRQSGFDYEMSGRFAWNEAVNAMDQQETRDKNNSVIAAIRGALNQIEADTK